MGRILTLAVVVAFLAGCGVDDGLRARLADPAIIAQVARQEAARADAEQARASAEQAKAAEAWARAAEADTRAAAVRASLPQLTAGFQAAAVGAPVVLLLALAGLGWAAARWAFRQASVFYPRAGVSPVIQVDRGGATYLIDAGRGLGSVTAIDADGRVKLPLAGPAEIHGQLAAQSLAAAVIASTAGSEAKAQATAAITKAVQGALAELPTLANGKPAPSIVFSAPKSGGGDMRVVSRNTPAPAPSSDTVKRGHFCEYLTHGEKIGFARRAWAGKKFADGEICTQSLWARLNTAARKANVLTDDGQKLRQPLDVTLAELGLDDLGE